MKKILTLRVPVWLGILVILLTLGTIAIKSNALITDYWDIGPWRVTSSGHLFPGADNTYNIGSSSYRVATAYIRNPVVGYTAITTSSKSLAVTDCGFLEVTGTTTTITLPTAVGNAGVWYSVKHSTTTGIVISLTPLVAGQTIDGTAGANTSMDANNDTLGVYSNGANWLIWTRYIQ